MGKLPLLDSMPPFDGDNGAPDGGRRRTIPSVFFGCIYSTTLILLVSQHQHVINCLADSKEGQRTLPLHIRIPLSPISWLADKPRQ
jgi:hypothetical protein